LQLIDGIDNQAPGLNFSLGNMVGAADLDVQSVDLVVGANSTMYGPGAFNGVLNMNTKNPFVHQGLTFSLKGGERSLFDANVRYAKAFQNKQGRDVFAFKVNAGFMRAYDWEATNLNATDDTKNIVGPGNPGGYNAINRYGDDSLLTQTQSLRRLGFSEKFTRTGYLEPDLADYNTKSIKVQSALHYRIRDSLELVYGYNFGTGTTIYQGDNRFSLKDLQFQQHKVELHGKKFEIKAYMSYDNAGKSYDIVRTAALLQLEARNTTDWQRVYINYLTRTAVPDLRTKEGFVNPDNPANAQAYAAFLARPEIQEQLRLYELQARAFADSGLSNSPIIPAPTFAGQYGRLVPGTAAFTQAFQRIISNSNGFGQGTRFLDESRLYHVQGNYLFTPKFADVRVGGNFRLYAPESFGTILSDTLIDREDPSKGYATIRNWEVGGFVNAEKKVWSDRLKVNAALRVDKNQNFNVLFSPAVSALLTVRPSPKFEHIFRFSLGSAIRNPTLQDQYLNLPLNPPIKLLGNLNGLNNVVAVQDYVDYLNLPAPDTSYNFLLERKFNVDKIRPEQARTVELGYRGTLGKHLFLDFTGYASWYQDFLGFLIVAQLPNEKPEGFLVGPDIYRVTANAPNSVYTVGASLQANIFVGKYYEITANWSYNKLLKTGVTDTAGRELTNADRAQLALLPAFNTPENKFNIGFNGKDIVLNLGEKVSIKGLGFNVNLKWVQGFEFQGAPQFSGSIPSYYVVDGQVSYAVKKWHTVFKVGASNLLNNLYLQAYGGPYIGRMAYGMITVDLK
jgi:outer membrane receptor protein involved in Fe transport